MRRVSRTSQPADKKQNEKLEKKIDFDFSPKRFSWSFLHLILISIHCFTASVSLRCELISQITRFGHVSSLMNESVKKNNNSTNFHILDIYARVASCLRDARLFKRITTTL